MSAYKTESAAKTQASKKHGKNWAESYFILECDEGFEIVTKMLPEPPAEVILPQDVQEELEESMPQNAGVCSALFGAMLNPASVPAAPAPAPKKEAEKTGKTIEQNRPEQNGLKRPSKGSTCCIIWDTCDRITTEKDSTCTSAELFNALQGYNECTLRTQYARWRQFNGITGRLPGQNKAAKLPAAFDDAKDILLSRIAEDDAAYATLESVKTAADLIQWIADNATSF